MRHGAAIEEDKDGKRIECNYENGKREGAFVETDRNGAVVAQGTYSNGYRKTDK